jgi:hypothetical protein
MSYCYNDPVITYTLSGIGFGVIGYKMFGNSFILGSGIVGVCLIIRYIHQNKKKSSSNSYSLMREPYNIYSVPRYNLLGFEFGINRNQFYYTNHFNNNRSDWKKLDKYNFYSNVLLGTIILGTTTLITIGGVGGIMFASMVFLEDVFFIMFI